MKNFEIVYEGYKFPVTVLPNGKKIVDLYSNELLFGDKCSEIRYDVKKFLEI